MNSTCLFLFSNADDAEMPGSLVFIDRKSIGRL